MKGVVIKVDKIEYHASTVIDIGLFIYFPYFGCCIS